MPEPGRFRVSDRTDISGTGRVTDERASVLRVPGGRPSADRGRAGRGPPAIEPGEDHGYQLHQRVSVGELRGRSQPDDAALLRRASVSGELGYSPDHAPAATHPAQPEDR